MLLPALAILAGALFSADVDASDLIPEMRIATAYQGKFDVDIFTAAWYGRAPRWTHADRLEFSAGVVSDTNNTRPFIFVGPVWGLAGRPDAAFLDFSFGPTVLGGSTFDGRELGGNLHFRSALAFGFSAGRQHPVNIALRIEHVSNGGLRDDNPGLDSIGLSIVGNWGGR